MSTSIKINVESYNAYNSGYLLGKWHDITDLDQDEFNELMKTIREETEKKLSKLQDDKEMIYSVCEEFFCPDYEIEINGNDFGNLVSDGPCLGADPQSIFDLKEQFEEIESVLTCDISIAVYAEFLNNNDHEESLKLAQDGYTVPYRSESDKHQDIGEYFIDEMGCMEIPDHLANYIDYESYGSDMCHDNHIDIEVNGQSYAFFYN